MVVYLLNELAPHISIPILRNARQALILITIRTVDIPNSIACSSVEIVCRAFETNERGTRTIYLIALFQARQKHHVGTPKCRQRRIALCIPRCLWQECRENLLRPIVFGRCKASDSRLGWNGREAIRVIQARFTTPREGDTAKPLPVFALAVVTAYQRRVPVSPACKRGQDCGEVGKIGNNRIGDLGRKIGAGI